MIGIDAYETLAIALYESWVRSNYGTRPDNAKAYGAISAAERNIWRTTARRMVEEASEQRLQVSADAQAMYEVLNPPLSGG